MLKMCQERCEDEDVEQNGPSLNHILAFGLNWERLTRLLDGKRIDMYLVVVVVHEYFGARFAVFVRRARVLPGPCPATRNLSFWRFHRHRHPVVSTRNFYWDGTGWYENSTRWKSCKLVRTRGRGA